MFIDAATSYALIFFPMLLVGVGTAITVPAINHAVLSHAPAGRVGVASAALNTARQIGGVVGVGVFGSFLVGGVAQIVSGVHGALLCSALALVGGCWAAWKYPPSSLAATAGQPKGDVLETS